MATRYEKLETAVAPLKESYLAAGLTLPAIELIEPSQIPEPYRSLLSHDQDMTPTLESFHQQQVHLRTLRSQRTGDVFWRQVVMALNGAKTPVAFGAINIYLNRFDPQIQRMILENRRPLGGILQGHGMIHSSQPQAFFKVTSDALINEALHLTGTQVLFGRSNRLLDPTQQVLADIVEILPPTDSRTTSA